NADFIMLGGGKRAFRKLPELLKKGVVGNMDTDYLSRECYKAIIIEAEKLSHDLTLHYGLLSIDCKNEDEYIDKAEQMTREIMQADDAELEDLFWGNLPAHV